MNIYLMLYSVQLILQICIYSIPLIYNVLVMLVLPFVVMIPQVCLFLWYLIVECLGILPGASGVEPT